MGPHLLPPHGMPGSPLLSAAVVGRHLLRKARSRRLGLRPLLADAVFFELARKHFGYGSMLRGPDGFFPHIFMPDYHGPHFDEALARLSLPHRGPNILYFSITGRCPCHCEYCFAGAGGADPPDIGSQAVYRVATEVARLRVPLVNLSGGEPLARYERLLRSVEILSEGSEVRLFTTGIGLTRPRLEALRQAGLKGIFVSLDTEDAEAFDQRRQRPGTFAAALAALRLCADTDMLTFINCVVDRDRFPADADVARFLRFVQQIDPRIVVNFLPQLATGRGTEAHSFRQPEDCEQVAERIVRVGRKLRRPVTMLFGEVDRFMGCPGAGGKLMNVDIEGNVTVCISRAALGNLLCEPFEQIYQRFVRHCDTLSTGFFCCEVAHHSDGELLDLSHSLARLQAFAASTPRAVWQQRVDRFGPLMGLLFPASAR